MFAFATWANNLALDLGLEAKGTGWGAFWDWADLEVTVAAIAEKGQVAASFEAVLDQSLASYYKANFKLNLPWLETKQGDLCLHIFKYIKYKGDHQANLNLCLFYKHYFNRE